MTRYGDSRDKIDKTEPAARRNSTRRTEKKSVLRDGEILQIP